MAFEGDARMTTQIPSLPPAAFRLLQYWKTARGPHVLPHRTSIDPIKLHDWLDDLSIIEIHAGEKSFFVRVHGSETRENLGQDFSGRYLEDCMGGDAVKLAVEPYIASIETLLPTFSTIEDASMSAVFGSLDRLVLPFTDVDQSLPDAPVSVERIVTWLGPTDRQRGEQTTVYNSALQNGRSGEGIANFVSKIFAIDVDDERYGLDDPNHSIAPFAAQRPLAKHAWSR